MGHVGGHRGLYGVWGVTGGHWCLYGASGGVLGGHWGPYGVLGGTGILWGHPSPPAPPPQILADRPWPTPGSAIG